MFIGVLRVVEGLRRLRSAIGRQKAPQQTEQILSKRQERTLVPAHDAAATQKKTVSGLDLHFSGFGQFCRPGVS